MQVRSGRRLAALKLAVLVAVSVLIGLSSGVQRGGREEAEPKGFDDPLEAVRWIQLAQRDETGTIRPNGLMIAKGQADAMRERQRRRFAGFAPQEIPSIAGINNGTWTWIGPGNIGGRTRALAIHPTNPQVILAGGVAGGIWRTSNAGASWAPVDDFMANLAVSCIVYKPGDPSKVFAGTGEGFFNGDAIKGAGIFQSDDGGITWRQLPSTTGPGETFTLVNRLAFSADGSVLLAAASGVRRSVDNGASWVPTLATLVTDVRFLPGSSTAAVAVGYGRAFFSTDAGATWTPSAGLNGTGDQNLNRIELGVSVSSPTTVYASYAVGGASSSPPAEVWRSLDGGASYSLVSAPGHLGNQGWYDNAVWVDPTDVDHVVLGGINRYRSTNGSSFVPMSGVIHVDHHIMVSDPGYDGGSNRKVYYGNDGGVYRLEDARGPGFIFTPLNNNYGVTQFYGGAGHAATGKIIGGTQDNGSLLYTPAAGAQAWTQFYPADGGFAAIDPTDPNYLYGETQWLGVHRNTTGGASPSTVIHGCGGPAPLQDACVIRNSNFIAPILLDPNDPNRLYAGGLSLWRNSSARSSSLWANVKPWAGGPSGNFISAIAIATGQPDVMWVGDNRSQLFKTTNGTSGSPAWMHMNTIFTGTRMTTSIAIDSANPEIVWASFGGYAPGGVWKSTNGGTSWSDASGTGAGRLPDVPVRSVIVHPVNSDWAYAGTDVGVFATEDGGITWQIPHDGPANVAVFQLFFMGTTLVAVTHGRGIFTADATSQPPVITQHPSNRSAAAGASTTFTAAATGAPVPTWQWQRWSGSAWLNLSDAPPYAGTATPTLSVTNATVSLSGSQYRAVASNLGGSATSNPALLTVYSAGVSLVTNGDFGGAMGGWQLFELPDIVSNITDGVLQFYKQIPTSTPSGQAVVFQHTGVSVAAGSALSASFDLGNSSSVRKRVTVLLLDSNFSDLHVCTFFLPAGAPLRTFAMRTHANQAWADAAIYFYAASSGSDGGYYLLDNVSMAYDPEGSTTRTECVDPLAPVPPGGPAGSNLFGNGDFGTGSLAPWSTFGTITWQVAGGVFEFVRPSTSPPAGVLLQAAGPMPAGQILTATFQLGSSSAQRQRVTILLNDADFSDLTACTFWIPPGQPLGTYTMRVFTTKAWGNAMLSMYPATPGGAPWLRFDNASLQTTPASTALGTECMEPGSPTSLSPLRR